MNRRGFITSALKATAAGLLVPEHLFGRAMVAGFRPARIYYGKHTTFGLDPAWDLELMKVAMSFALEPSEKTVFVSPVMFPDVKERFQHIIKIVEGFDEKSS